jgi:hypothetical protein
VVDAVSRDDRLIGELSQCYHNVAEYFLASGLDELAQLASALICWPSVETRAQQ